MSSRRLSRGSSSNLGDFGGSDIDDEDVSPLSERPLARHRSSVGGKVNGNGVSKVEQTRIADMYKTVIKLAAENKITAKNSWNLELIDHMGSLIKDDSSDRENRGVNFQKASCTLDASVKIYSHRVDDTWSTSFRILENLSRGNNVSADADTDEDGTKAVARVGTKAMSNRLNLTSTIEKNISNLNSDVLDTEHGADPMFHKMSQAFDEGGAKGMLMANLRVAESSCSLCFSSENKISQNLQNEVQTHLRVDVSDLIFQSGFTSRRIFDLPVSATLQSFRSALNLDEIQASCLDLNHLTRFSNVTLPESTGQSSGTLPVDLDDNSCDDGDVGDVFDMAMDDDTGGFEEVNRRRSSILKSPAMRPISTVPGAPEGDWDNMFKPQSTSPDADKDVRPVSPGHLLAEPENKVLFLPSASAPGDEYSFFDSSAVQSIGCHWAGSKHWKTSLRTVVTKTIGQECLENSPEVISGEDSHAIKQKGPKPVFRFEFTSSAVNISQYSKPISKRGGDSTILSDLSVEKSTAIGKAGALKLPPDAKFYAKDLCRMFLRPNLIVPPRDFEEILKNSLLKQKSNELYSFSTGGSISVPKCLYGEKDFVWGSYSSKVTSAAVSKSLFAFKAVGAHQFKLSEEENDNDIEFIDEGGDFDYDDNPDVNACSVDNVISQLNGLAINGNNLLQNSRTVQKIDIGYATVAKRVNVKKLKCDLWGRLNDSLVPDSCPVKDTENRLQKTTPDLKPAVQTLSFQDVVNDISQQQQQSDVSLSFYFICLLHLANEKNLEISGMDTMSDLIIKKG